MTGPDVTGVGEYAEKAARDAITESEARAIALQGIVEFSRGVDIAVSEIRKGLFMQAAETLLLAKAGCVVAEAAIQKIRTDEARVEERERIAAEEEGRRMAQAVAPIHSACGQRHYGPVCLDGLVMCCICGRRVTTDRLVVLVPGDGHSTESAPVYEDVCLTCRRREEAWVASDD